MGFHPPKNLWRRLVGWGLTGLSTQFRSHHQRPAHSFILLKVTPHSKHGDDKNLSFGYLILFGSKLGFVRILDSLYGKFSRSSCIRL